MWWSETDNNRQGATGPTRRAVLVAGLAALSACGFTPVYGPQGGGTRLLDVIALPIPTTDTAYAFNRRFEERLGRVRDTAIYDLSLRLETTDQDIGVTATGNTTRIRLLGRAFYVLKDKTTGKALHEGRTTAFTGYSTTGSTVATRAAQRDAQERLMVILADQVIDDLILHAPDFTALTTLPPTGAPDPAS